MDQLEQYRQWIMDLLQEYTTRTYANADIQNKTVYDRQADRYLVMSEGWDHQGRRIHGCLIDLEILQNKIWIQRDGTEHGIARDLMDVGIPKEQIVLGFKPPDIRPYTGFAVV